MTNPERPPNLLAERFQLDGELGRGGMAVVYRGIDLRHRRPVAIKVLLPTLATVFGPDRFLREIAILARLSHPHILPLLDSGVTAVAAPSGNRVEVPFYVMPLVEGESLKEVLERRGRLPLPEALAMAVEIADALQYAHGHGVIHRDIKPANILIQSGHAMVADFGIARALGIASEERLTSSGVSLGTPQYMSPEQAAGSTTSLGGETDIYSLGCVLFEMITGKPPYSGTTHGMLASQHAAAPVPSVRQHRGEISEAVDRVIQRALAKRPEDRFRTAGALLEALRGLSSTPRRFPIRSVVVGALALVVAGLLWWRVSNRAPASLDRSLLAVAPFEVPVGADELAVWHEGMVDLLSRSLDGAGTLRAVAPTVVIRRWAGRADRSSGVELGRRTGAGLVLIGQILPSGTDSVRLTSQLWDAEADGLIREYDLRGPVGQVDRLADSLAMAVFRAAPDQDRSGVLRAGLGHATPLPALKAFLNGERLYRRASWDSALVAYDLAIELDSAFAFAWHRAGTVLAWLGTNWDTLAINYQTRAAGLNRGLAARDSVLVWADSLSGAIYGLEGPVQGTTWRLLRGLQEGTRRWPDDPDIWRTLGEVAFHHGLEAGMSRADVLAAFERAIELDSAYAPSYVHPITLAFSTRGRAEGIRYLTAFLRHAPSGFQAEGIRLAADLMAPGAATRPEVARRLKGLAPAGLFEGWAASLWAADSGMAAVHLAAELDRRELTNPPTLANREFRRGLLVSALDLRGRLQEAVAIGGPGLAAEVAAIGVAGPIADETVAAHLSRSASGHLEQLAALNWWAARRDTGSLESVIRRCQGGSISGPPCWGRLAARMAGAHLQLLRGDSAGALESLQSLPDTLCPLCISHRVTIGRLLVAGRDPRAATVFLARELTGLRHRGGATEAFWVLLQAQAAEAAGDSVSARRRYAIVLGQWSAADSIFDPLIGQARAGLARVGGSTQ